MDRMKVGVILNSRYAPSDGGAYSYYDRLIIGIDKYDFETNIEICFLNFTDTKIDNFKKPIINCSLAKLSNWNKQSRALYKIFLLLNTYFKRFEIAKLLCFKIQGAIYQKADKLFLDNKLDLIYFLTQDYVSFNYPYIITHWDLGHKSMFAFPEVALNGNFEFRDNYHRSVLQKAFAIFAESTAGKDELVYYERINPERIFLMPMFAGGVVSISITKTEESLILEKYGLKKGKFYFYPAQFWSHKNHINLLIAFKKVLQQFPDLILVLTGSDKGNLEYVLRKAKEFNIEASIVFAGFVDLSSLYTFYKNAIALVMPTFLGPTNMPLLEAYELGCKVICSNFAGHVELLKGYALYFEANDAEDIYLKMILVFEHSFLETHDIPTLDKALKMLNQNLIKLSHYRKSFGINYDQK